MLRGICAARRRDSRADWPVAEAMVGARMFASTAKGFHVHPPSVPEGSAAADWLRRLFVDEPENYSLRRYDDEQWDVMFFFQGRVEMILCDIRAGLPRRVMRFFVDGDNHRGNNKCRRGNSGRRGARDSRRRRGRCHHGLRDKHDFPSRIRGTHRERNRKLRSCRNPGRSSWINQESRKTGTDLCVSCSPVFLIQIFS